MPDYWLDTNSFITPSRGPFRFPRAIKFWDYMEEKDKEHVIGSPVLVLTKELYPDGIKKPDGLATWAKQQKDTLFIDPNEKVQNIFSQIAERVKLEPRYHAEHVVKFLDGADIWVIAYAKVFGGKVVTFEKSEPLSSNPKIPDVACSFGVLCINIWDMLDDLKAPF
jgi:hypothetical protein